MMQQVHAGDEPVLEAVPLWRVKPPRPIWLRVRLLLLMAALWGILLWYALGTDPLLSVRDGLVATWNAKWWLDGLFGLELVRQVHYLASERWGAWHHFWADIVFGSVNRRIQSTNSWARYRFKRIAAVVIVLAAIAVIAGAALHESPVTALFALPGKAVGVLGFAAYIIGLMLIYVGGMMIMFWYLARGGMETFFPEDIKTRFSHVWGQDAVLERIKESIVFLDDPESIEARGGYVPGGILLWGPPGTGKTLMAEAVAGETGKPFVFVEPGAFLNMFVGIGVLKVKGLFRKLRKLAMRYGGVIVFFDEADSIGSRGGMPGSGIFGPGGRQGAQTWPWSTGDCHGGSYLSRTASAALVGCASANVVAEARAFDRPGHEPPRRVREKMMYMGGGGGDGTVEALLAEISGLSKPRGFMNKVVRKVLGIKPTPPPKYRILIMMATNRPDTLDEAMLRPGRIDRIYKVGYPSKAGRLRTYEGYFGKVRHDLNPGDFDKLATMTPYATGATIKDLVNESLIVSLRRGHDTITWADVMEAKKMKDLGLPDDVEYVERERHAVALHEACHAVVAYRVRKHLEIDLATIEKGGTYLGMVSSIQPDDRFTSWRSEYEADVMVSLASLAGERHFFAGDSSSGVSSDLESATTLASLMEGYWGMGSTIASHAVSRKLGTGGGPGAGDAGGKDMLRGDLGHRIESKLSKLYELTLSLVEDNKVEVFAITHALESHKTINGEDVEAIIEGRPGRAVDGRVYKSPQFAPAFSAYHEKLVEAHSRREKLAVALPRPEEWAPELAVASSGLSGNGSPGDGPGQLEGAGAP